MTKFAVLVSGSGTNLQAILDAIRSGELQGEVSVVLSNKSKVQALERAARAGVPCITLPHRDFDSREAFDQAMVNALREHSIDWVVLAGFMRLLTPVFLDAYQDRIINLHPSLLPAFPGSHGIRDAIRYGVKVTGCTVHLVTAGMDAGPIIDQVPVPVTAEDTEQSLLARVQVEEHDLLVDVLRRASEGRLRVETTISGSKRVLSIPARQRR